MTNPQIEQLINSLVAADSAELRQALADDLTNRLKNQSTEGVLHAYNSGYAIGHSVGKEAVMNAVEAGLMAAVGEIRKSVIGEPS